MGGIGYVEGYKKEDFEGNFGDEIWELRWIRVLRVKYYPYDLLHYVKYYVISEICTYLALNKNQKLS